jgi:capsular exopolysaccharide synthesis family protein
MSTSNQGLQLRDCYKVINERRRVVFTVLGTAVALVLVANFIATPRYQGVTKVLIERGDSEELSGRARGAYDAEFYQTQFQLIKSRAVARRVVDILALPEDYAVFLAEGSSLDAVESLAIRVQRGFKALVGRAVDPLTPQSGQSWQDQAAAAISADIKVAPLAESHLVTISYTSADPVFAAQVANTTAQAFIEQSLKMKIEATRRSLGWMVEKAEEERKALETAEQDLQAYMQANGIVTLENRITVTPERLSELSSQLVRAEVRRKELETLYTKVAPVEDKPMAAEAVTAIAVDPTLQALRTQIVQSEKEIMELTNKYGPRHPLMIKATNDLSMLQNKRQLEIRRIVRTIKNDYELALANEQSLRSQLDLTKAETMQLNERFIRYGALKREVDTIRQTYDALTLKLREQGITGENQPVNLWIVEEAEVPLAPSTPRKGLNLLLGLLLGVAGGVGLAFLLDYLDNRITDPDEAEIALATPVLSVIPLCRENSKQIEGIVLQQPLSAFSENYKTLRSVLQLASAEATSNKILVTSAVMGEGKTTTAVNLAIALAQTEKRVVLIDGDLRKSRLHKLFKTDSKVGLSTYLTGAHSEGMLQPGPVPNLSIIASGPIPPNPSELIASKRLRSLLDALSEKFDYIICDSPPVLMVADALVLGRIFDGTILVTKAHRTTHEVATRALKLLRDRNIEVLGMVINGMDPKHNEYYYGEYHAAAPQRSLVPARALLAGASRRH